MYVSPSASTVTTVVAVCLLRHVMFVMSVVSTVLLGRRCPIIVSRFGVDLEVCGIGLALESAFSALTLLVGRQKGHPACKKQEWCGAGVVVCLEQGADLHTARLMPLPLTVSCFSKIQIGFTFLVPTHLGSPGKGPLDGCVCVLCVVVFFSVACQRSIQLYSGQSF